MGKIVVELLDQACKTCGADLKEYNEEFYKCEGCGHFYTHDAAKKYVETMRSLMDDAKYKEVSNARKNLYHAVTAEYISSEHIHECCVILKQLLPDDFQANFYEIAISNNVRRIAQAIRAIDPKEQFCHMDALIRFLILSLQSEYILETGDLIERTYKNTDLVKYEHFSTMLSVEAQKLDDCIYMTTYPRDVFVAYSSKDMDQVFKLVECLEDQGLSCFVAVRNLRHGKGSVEDYEKALKEAMDNCRSFVFVSSPNSRHPGCDALKKEIPYIKSVDIKGAPAEYRGDYGRIPHRYKKHRVEYRIQESLKPMAADRIVSEFFDGYERVYSPDEVAERVLLAEIESVPASQPVKEPVHVGSQTEQSKQVEFHFAENLDVNVGSATQSVGRMSERQDNEVKTQPAKSKDSRKERPSAVSQTRTTGVMKSKVLAVVLALFFGAYGIDQFYLGYVKKGVARIIVTVVTCGTGGVIWSVIDCIRIARGKISVDAQGNPIK